MTKKFTDKEMKQLHANYYHPNRLVKVDETTNKILKNDLRIVREIVTDEIKKDNSYFFDIVELDHDVIRFNLTREHDCGCRYFLVDRSTLGRLEKFIHDYLNDKI